MKTAFVVVDTMEYKVEILRVEDAILERIVDEEVVNDGLNFEEVMKDVFSDWCANEFGWWRCDSAYEVLTDGRCEKFF